MNSVQGHSRAAGGGRLGDRFRVLMLRDGLADRGGSIDVMDIVELVDRATG